MLVSEIMSAPAVTVAEDAFLRDVAAVMTEHSVGCLPVVDKSGGLVGVISETDFIGSMRNVPFSRETGHVLFGKWTDGKRVVRCCAESAALKLSDFMRTRVVTVEEGDTVEYAVTKMLKNHVHRLPVVKGGKPVGMFARRDLLKLFE